MMAPGNRIKLMEEESLNGLMAEFIKENIKITT